MWRTATRNLDVLLIAATACFGAGLFAVWSANGFGWSSSAPAPKAVSAQHASPLRPAAPARSPRQAERRPRPVPGARAAPPTLTLVAARGAAWVSIRSGSAGGRTIYEGLLPHRRTLSLRGRAYVARFQASGNLVARIGGRRTDLRPFELRSVAITRRGIRLLAGTQPPSAAPAVLAS